MTTLSTDNLMPNAMSAEPMETRIKSFRDKTIKHPHLDEAMSSALDAIRCRDSINTIVMVGPTGVGKSTLASRLVRDINEQYADEVQRDPGMTPVVEVSVASNSLRGFNWRDFYYNLLIKLDNTQPQLKLPLFSGGYPYGDALAMSMPRTGNYDRAAVNALRQRRVQVLLIEDADELIAGCKPHELRARFQAIAALAVEAGVTAVMVGTYELADIWLQRPKLLRGCRCIHLRRYGTLTVGDQDAFAGVLDTLAAHMPFTTPVSLATNVGYFWTHTAGCVGILKDWLNRAVESGVRQGLDTVDAAFVCQFKPDSRFIQVVLEDALEGEKRLAEVSSNRIQEIIVAQASAPKKAAEPINLDAFFSPPRQARRVGERNPSRDPVGGGRQLIGA